MPPPRTNWFKSSYSQQDGLCLEARHTATGVDIRDSKNTGGPHLQLTPEAWTSLLHEVREER